jgi:hypothetical protein
MEIITIYTIENTLSGDFFECTLLEKRQPLSTQNRLAELFIFGNFLFPVAREICFGLSKG